MMNVKIEEFGDHIVISDPEFKREIPKDEYEILQRIADKYSVPIEALVAIMILEEKATKIGKKWGVKKDIKKVINHYFTPRHSNGV